MHYLKALGTFGLLATVGSGGLASSTALKNTANWDIGPDVRGVNYSVGMPLKPTPNAKRGWSFAFPYPGRDAGHVHAITYNSGPLINASKIVMRYRIDAGPNVRFEPQETPGQQGTVSLYFQRQGDNWSAKRKYDFYRWYSLPSVRKLNRGEYEIVVSFSDPYWQSVHGNLAPANPEYFHEALAHTKQIGIAFGGPSGFAHGVYTTGPARFTLLEFRIM